MHDSNRRDFLKTSSTAIMLASAGWGRNVMAQQPQAQRAKVLVGGHPWVYADKLPGCDITPILPTIFADMRYAGLDGIELMHTALRPEDAVARIADLSQMHRLPIIGTSFGGEMWDRAQHKVILEDAELVVTRLARLGGRTLGTSVGSTGRKKTPEQLDAQAELLRRIIALCDANGVVLNLHNHTHEVISSFYDLKGTLARIPEVKLGPDLNWLVRAGIDPAGFIRQYGKQIVFLHLRDQRADGRWSEAVGEGVTDFTAIGKALHKVQFQGDVVIELAHEADFKPTRPLRESLKISRACVRRLMGY